MQREQVHQPARCSREVLLSTALDLVSRAGVESHGSFQRQPSNQQVDELLVEVWFAIDACVSHARCTYPITLAGGG